MSLKNDLGNKINDINLGNDLYIFSKPDICDLGTNLNKIMREEFRKTDYLLIENNLIPNIIFLMYLQYYIDKDNVEIFKRNYANIIKTMNRNNYNKKMENINYNKDKYREVVKNLKEKHRDAFIDWLCKLKEYLKNNAGRIRGYIDKIKKEKKMSENVKKLVDDISKIGKKETIGDYLNYYITFGYLLTVLKIENNEIYKNLINPKLERDNMFNFKDNLLEMYEYIYQLAKKVEPYAIPMRDNCKNFDSIIDEEKADCYSAVLNDTFYFTSEIGALKNVGENININKYLSKINQIYYIKSLEEIREKNEKGIYNRIRGIFKGIGMTNKREANILYGKTEDVIFISQSKDNNILIKVVCKEVDKNNKNVKRYGRDVISVEVRGRGSKKVISIICLGREIERIVMTIDDKSGSMLVIMEKGLRYNLIREEDKIYLLNLCDKIVKPRRITYKIKDDKISQMIVSDVNPREFVIAAIIGLIMIDNMDLFNKLSDKMTEVKTIC